VVVAAAGNAGVASQFFPAAEPHVISVAATDDGDRRYSWSNYGGWVQLAAPGCLPTTVLGGGYGVECGTSFAAPVVAGLAGLALAARPALDAASVADALARGAVAVGDVVRAGRIDAARTLTLLPRVEPAAGRTSVTFRLTLTRARPSRVFAVTAMDGVLDVTATFARGRTLTVEIVAPNGRALLRARGRSPLRLSRAVTAATYRVRVHGGRTAFALSVGYPRAP
jgi:subtilisin family serine protease